MSLKLIKISYVFLEIYISKLLTDPCRKWVSSVPLLRVSWFKFHPRVVFDDPVCDIYRFRESEKQFSSHFKPGPPICTYRGNASSKYSYLLNYLKSEKQFSFFFFSLIFVNHTICGTFTIIITIIFNIFWLNTNDHNLVVRITTIIISGWALHKCLINSLIALIKLIHFESATRNVATNMKTQATIASNTILCWCDDQLTDQSNWSAVISHEYPRVESSFSRVLVMSLIGGIFVISCVYVFYIPNESVYQNEWVDFSIKWNRKLLISFPINESVLLELLELSTTFGCGRRVIVPPVYDGRQV